MRSVRGIGVIAIGMSLAAAGFTVHSAVAQSSVSEPQLVASDATQQTALPPGETADLIHAIQTDRTQRMTLPVRINDGTERRFVVDTGAERTVISAELAAQQTLTAEPPVRLATITGPITVPAFYVERMRIGSVDVQPSVMPALQRRDMGGDGMIGINSLQNHRVILDFKTRQMELYPSSPHRITTGRHDDIVVVGARRRDGRLILSNARINGRRVDVIIDTGAQSSIGNMALRRLVESRRSGKPLAELISVTGDSINGFGGRINEIVFNGMTLTNAPVTYTDSYAFEVLGLSRRPALLLGMDMLEMFDRIEIDFGARRVIFTMPRNAGLSRGHQWAAR